MRRTVIAIALASLPLILLLAQQQRPAHNDFPAYEIRSAFPREVSAGHYEQVQQRDLEALADQGWELVSVMPWIYRNEEHGGDSINPKPVVTQAYPAYFFKRERAPHGR